MTPVSVGSSTNICHFDKIRERLFDKALADYGFKRIESLTERNNEQNRFQAYVKERSGHTNLYITIWATTYYRADVDRIEIKLGEGETGYPEGQFNSIELSTLVCSKYPTRKTDVSEAYGIYTISDIKQHLEQVAKVAANDLFTYGQDFLNDQLQDFYEVRRNKNRTNKYWQSISESIDTRTDQYAESLQKDLAIWDKYTR